MLMAKKRRRIKKNVKKGCGIFLLMLVVILSFSLVRCGCSRSASTENADSTDILLDDVIPHPHINQSVKEDLTSLIQSPQRLDTSLIAISIYDLTADKSIMQWHDNRLMIPASCLKLLTAITALERYGLKHMYNVSESIYGETCDGTLRGVVLIQADDDPMFDNLTPLAETLKEKGIERIEGGVILSLMRDDTLKAHPAAAFWDIPYHKVPVLLKGRERVERELLTTFRSQGIAVVPTPIFVPLELLDPPASSSYRFALNLYTHKAERIYTHQTPLTDVITPMLIHSSNIKADALFYHLDHSFDHLTGHHEPSRHLTDIFIDEDLKYTNAERQLFTIEDGSGLCPDNNVTADFLTRLLIYAWQRKEMRHYLIHDALATPGHPERHGSLLGRMTAPAYRNRIFCKTGTLVTRGASSLAGYAKGTDGHWYAFSIINEDSPVAESRIFQDKVCHILVQ